MDSSGRRLLNLFLYSALFGSTVDTCLRQFTEVSWFSLLFYVQVDSGSACIDNGHLFMRQSQWPVHFSVVAIWICLGNAFWIYSHIQRYLVLQWIHVTASPRRRGYCLRIQRNACSSVVHAMRQSRSFLLVAMNLALCSFVVFRT